MPSRAHAAHAVPFYWFDTLRIEIGVLARAVARVWRNAALHRQAPRADHAPLCSGPRRRPAGLLWQHVDMMWRRHCSRQRISRLDALLLKDIGVSYAEAEAEANKPFWRA